MSTDEKEILALESQEIFTRLTSIHDFFNSITKSTTIGLVEAKKLRCDQIQTEFKDLRTRIHKFNVSEKDPAQKIVLRIDQFDDLIDIIISNYHKFLNKTTSQGQGSSSASNVQHSAISLPKIQLPTFSGKIEEWNNFYTLFSSMVHTNKDVPAIQKFQLLRAHLKDEALALIANIQLNDANYYQAYATLKDRFSNPRRLVHFYLNQILQYNDTDHKSYAKYIASHVNCVEAIKGLNLTDLADTILFNLSYLNLNSKDKLEFDNQVTPGNVPSTKELFEFIQKKAKSFELLDDCKASNSSSAQAKPAAASYKKKWSKPDKSDKVSLLANNTSKGELKVNPQVCPVCNQEHRIYFCKVFKDLTLDQKRVKLTALGRCFICLSHHSGACNSTSGCKKCQSVEHNTLICPQEEDKPVSLISSRPRPTNQTSTVLLSTVEIEIQDSAGAYHRTKAVLDQGSMINAISAPLAKRLGLRCLGVSSSVKGFGLTNCNYTKTTKCLIRSPHQWRSKVECSAVIVENICSNLPSTQLPERVVQHFKRLSLADKTFHIPSQIEVLLGVEIYAQILLNEAPVIQAGFPVAVKSSFGFILFGTVDSQKPDFQPENKNPVSLFIQSNSMENLDETMRAFWEQEEVKLPTPVPEEDVLAENHFLQNFTRTEEGRFQVRLCFKPNATPLGSNREVAMKRFLNLERRLSKDLQAKEEYEEFFKGYIMEQHMSVAPTVVDFILPHHAIYKPLSSTSRVRAVFDASSLDNNNSSLNSKLVVGPKLQKDLPQIIDAFRSHAVAVCCDIQRMYRNILLAPEDRKYTHIFWRSSTSDDVTEYELNTVTYGLSSSPFLAQRCIKQLITEHGEDYKLASVSLNSHCYIDDVISGQPSLESAKQLQQELTELLGKACFKVKKWSSNSPELLSRMQDDEKEKLITFSDGKRALKILGLIWNPDSDEFSYEVSPFEGPVTKRSILSYISRIFDCNGFLSPVILKAKRYIQELWLMGLTWDQEVPPTLQKSWMDFVKEFPLLCQVKIPRKIFYQNAVFRLIGMCDASQDGLGCLVYLHASADGISKCHLLRAKTKVTPLKTLTIPRAELTSAVLLTKLVKLILVESFPFTIEEVIYFTDSKNVLTWISTSPHLLKTFVSNRVVQILDSSKPEQWFHVSTTNNSSDICSRGASASQLLNHDLYWHGPTFLQQPYEEWNLHKPQENVKEILEKRNLKIGLLTISEENPILQLMKKVSSLPKLLRIVAYLLRFLQAVKSKSKVLQGPIRSEELQSALNLCITTSQSFYFDEEIKEIKGGKVPRSLMKLSPFLDETSFLRVGGRMEYSTLSDKMKHPVLLHHKSRLAQLICCYYHDYSCHAGAATVQALIQRKYWITSLRSLVKKVTFSCVRCYRLRAKPSAPKMAALPGSRVQPSPPFSNTGVDFCGFFEVKESLRRNAKLYKIYAAIFTCFSTRAAHVELVSSLSSEAFMAAFDRFAARRGLPSVVSCDNGTNFQGSSNELKQVQKWLNSHHDEIFSSLAARNIKFQFNCPTAASMGGVWESVVKQTKTLLYRKIGSQRLTFEEMTTVLIRIEAVLNSRPLIFLPSSPDDGVDYLSPGHFLIGRPILTFPEHHLPEDVTFQSRWQRLRQTVQGFWNVWSNQYLHTLQQRKKWCKPQTNLEKNQLVWISDVKTSPLSWPVGRITETFPGKDKIVRVVKVKTANGEYVRPVNKLIIIPISE